MDDSQIELYALLRQASDGDAGARTCTSYDITERKKLAAWRKKEGMSKADAMRLYTAGKETAVSSAVASPVKLKAIPLGIPSPAVGQKRQGKPEVPVTQRTDGSQTDRRSKTPNDSSLQTSSFRKSDLSIMQDRWSKTPRKSDVGPLKIPTTHSLRTCWYGRPAAVGHHSGAPTPRPVPPPATNRDKKTKSVSLPLPSPEVNVTQYTNNRSVRISFVSNVGSVLVSGLIMPVGVEGYQKKPPVKKPSWH